jgi:hypothetical protein
MGHDAMHKIEFRTNYRLILQRGRSKDVSVVKHPGIGAVVTTDSRLAMLIMVSTLWHAGWSAMRLSKVFFRLQSDALSMFVPDLIRRPIGASNSIGNRITESRPNSSPESWRKTHRNLKSKRDS